MKNVFTARLLNAYQNKGSFYDKVRGHTGIDLDFVFESLPSPISGPVLLTLVQKEMGKTMYVRDALGAVHVFAHFNTWNVGKGDQVIREQNLGKTGDTGTAVSVINGKKRAHLHYEVITQTPFSPRDQKMVRNELPFKGFNTEPIEYLKFLYNHFGVDWQTGKAKEVPHNPNGF